MNNEIKDTCVWFSLQNSPEHWLQNNWHEKHMAFHRVSDDNSEGHNKDEKKLTYLL